MKPIWSVVGIVTYMLLALVTFASLNIGTTPTYVGFTLFNLAVMPVILFPLNKPFVGILQGICLIFISIFFVITFGLLNIFVIFEIFFIAGSVLAINILRFKKTRKPQSEATEFGYIVSDNAYLHPASSLPLWMRSAPILAFAGFLMFSALANIQLIPVLPAFGLTTDQMADTGMSMQGVQDAFFSSVPVGYAEDGVNLALVMTIIMWFSFIAYEVGNLSPSPVHGIAFLVVACFIGAFIFTSAHYTNPAYVSNPTAQRSAFGFSFINQLLFGLTGVFIPLPHILHNFFIVLSRYRMTFSPFLVMPIG